MIYPQVSTFPGINEQRKKAIIDHLLHLMSENHRSFWITLYFAQQVASILRSVSIVKKTFNAFCDLVLTTIKSILIQLCRLT